MMRMLTLVKSYIPLLIGLVILAIAIPLVPWAQVWLYLSRLSPIVVGLLIGSSMVFYLGRCVRYWLMLRMLERPLAFGKVLLACLVAQPVSILPGGELYRGAMLKRYGNVSLAHGLPSVFAQSIAETIGLLIIALIGVVILHRYAIIVVLVASFFGGLLIFIRHHDSRWTHQIVNAVPGVQVQHSRLRIFLQKNQTLLTGRNLVWLVAASFISTAAGIGITLLAAQGLGVELNLLEAAIAYSLSTILADLSFLPGGLGVNEHGLVGLLAIFGIATAPAVAITVVMRFFTLGIGFIYGFGAIIWTRFTHVAQYH